MEVQEQLVFAFSSREYKKSGEINHFFYKV
jgi:hypothetical protein